MSTHVEPSDLALFLVDTPDEEAKARAAAALYRHNVERTGIADRQPIGAKLVDARTGELCGGLWGRTELGLLFLDMFFVREDARGRGCGARLLTSVEDAARMRGCKGAVVETSSFQAPRFYTQHGYEEFGRASFGVADHARLFLQKKLA